MLGYFSTEGRGTGDLMVKEVAARLQADGIPLAGVVQENVERDPTRKCDMELHVLSGTTVICISQNLGRHARGCRLDPGGLEQAVGLVEAQLAHEPALLIVNKFGKQELEGRGFRPVIGAAIAAGLPVLTSINAAHVEMFLDFAEGLADRLPPDPDAIFAWCVAQARGASLPAEAS
ncbi:MAG: DUF2478 domain-containing protein [Pseudomonadota bacterium]